MAAHEVEAIRFGEPRLPQVVCFVARRRDSVRVRRVETEATKEEFAAIEYKLVSDNLEILDTEARMQHIDSRQSYVIVDIGGAAGGIQRRIRRREQGEGGVVQ